MRKAWWTAAVLGLLGCDLGPVGALGVSRQEVGQGDAGWLASSCLLDIQVSAGSTDRAIDFGEVVVGATATRTVALHNVGQRNCALERWRLSADAARDFTVVSPAAFPVVLAPDERVELTVQFTPAQSGYWEAAELELDTTEVNLGPSECADPTLLGCKAFSLSGLGVSLADVVPVPAALALGPATVGCRPASGSFVLVNRSSQNVSVTELVQKGGGFIVFPSRLLPAVVEPGEVLSFSVRFSANRVGPARGSVTLRHTGAEGEVTVPVRAEGVAPGVHTETWVQQPPPVDVLLVADDSASMNPWWNNVVKPAEGLLAGLQAQGVDFHFGFTTTDLESSAAGPGLLRGTPRVLTSSQPDALDQLRARLDIGSPRGSAVERGLEAMRTALLPAMTLDPLRNTGFLRDDSRLAVVLISEDNDESVGSVSAFAQTLRAVHPKGELGFYPVVVNDRASCRGSVVQGERYLTALGLIGGVAADLCAADIPAEYQRLLADLSRTAQVYRPRLSPSAAQPLTVKVNGVVASPASYSYSLPANTLRFAPGSTPADGAQVELSYDTRCQ